MSETQRGRPTGSLTAAAAFGAVHLRGGNTLEIPVYWEQVEPEEGRFDFASVDSMLAGARRAGVRLILLWFATWKNGDMDDAPEWVKRDPERFHRVTASSGKTFWVLSSYCEVNLEADKCAFAELCGHLDSHERVSLVTIERNTIQSWRLLSPGDHPRVDPTRSWHGGAAFSYDQFSSVIDTRASPAGSMVQSSDSHATVTTASPRRVDLRVGGV